MITDFILDKLKTYEDEPISIFLMIFMLFLLPVMILTFALDFLLFPIELIIFIKKRW